MEKIFGSLKQFVSSEEDISNRPPTALFYTPYQSSPVTIIGSPLTSDLLGKELILSGIWKVSGDSRVEFHVHAVEKSIASEARGVFNYLTSRMVKGIGPKIAEKIVEKFQEKAAFILDEAPERLLQIPGISISKHAAICKQLNEQKPLRSTLLFLQRYDIPIHYGRKIYNKYKETSIEKIRSDPFILAREIDGIGFKTADLVATKLGYPPTSDKRIASGILHALEEIQEEGHTCAPSEVLVERSLSLLNGNFPEKIVSSEMVLRNIALLEEQKKLFVQRAGETETVWSKYLYQSEQMIAQDIRRILSSPKNLREINSLKALEWVENKLNLKLATKQREAISFSFKEKLHIITGGPGTGKSTITKAILQIFERITNKIILAAPTGKAAKRMAEITGKHSVTIHSLLQYDFQTKSFKKNRNNPVDCDLVIVDESGMIDTMLMCQFLKALPDHVILILIGDVYQLPSIGPGNVLKDLIDSSFIQVTTLNEIFRQLQDSGIVTNAHRVNEGLLPELYSKNAKKDFLFYYKKDPQEIADLIVDLITKTIPEKYHIYPRDIQVLSPMKKGVLGIMNLNKSIKQALNPSTQFISKKLENYSVGDKVMQIRNNYLKEVFNGDIGYITHIDFQSKEMSVNYDNRAVSYSYSDLDELTLAYAVSVHKYQGSESPCVIVPIHTSHFVMLYRNLLYTAITRGKKLVILAGTPKAIAISVSTNKGNQRCTGLGRILEATNTQVASS
ncbi:SF1B family DNA helicase RecD2 [Chlamydiifrater volucris]|uniref:SF1B family DNA helicase RecD2 n=1 Tax=Chlamydiifrater volucris TaxID=2681470 RepID=UPI001BCD64B9|nr:ATP-dependent RecD-like DNA helicase [Chlamydiifrater volucris]